LTEKDRPATFQLDENGDKKEERCGEKQASTGEQNIESTLDKPPHRPLVIDASDRLGRKAFR
jgi:hypothetical protein